MGSHHHEQRVPKAALLGAAALILTTLALSAEARIERDSGSPSASAAVLQSVRLRFEDRPDGSVAVIDAQTSRQVAVVAPAEGGFVRGVMRGMFRTRMLESIPAHEHFTLMRLVDGSLVLEDPYSQRRVDLRSFGITNYRAFAELLEHGADPGSRP